MSEEVNQEEIKEEQVSFEDVEITEDHRKKKKVLDDCMAVYDNNFPAYCALIDDLTSGSLKRVTKVLAAYPFDSGYQLNLQKTGKNEKEDAALFYGKKLLDAKHAFMDMVVQIPEDVLRKLDSEKKEKENE
jgi:hypothetical protein